MICGVHVVVFAPEAGRARAFFRDALALESVDVPGLRTLGLYEPRHPRPPLR